MTNAPVPLRERKKARTRQLLRDVAHELFAQHGYDGTTVADIANAAEVSEPTFFRYYPSKASVAIAPLHDVVDVLLERFEAQPDNLAPIEACIATTHDELLLGAFRPEVVEQLSRVYDAKGFVGGLVQLFDVSRARVAIEVARRSGADPESATAAHAATLIVGIAITSLRDWLGDTEQGDSISLAREGYELLQGGMA